MRHDEIADRLDEIATYMELDGANAFKIRAYQNGARIVRGIGDELGRLVTEGTLREVEGIGKTLVGNITELLETGRIATLEELRQRYPPTLLEVLRVPGVGPKKAKALFTELGIQGLPDLQRAIEANALADLKGFGKKTQENLSRGIQFALARRGKFLLADALPAAEELLAALRAHPAVADAGMAGSLRRGKELVHDVDLLTAVADGDENRADIASVLTAHPRVAETIARGETKVSVRLHNGLQIDMRMVEQRQWAAALAYFTGSKAHNVRLRGLAQKLGYTLNEYALTRLDDGSPAPFDDEAGLYELLGLRWIAPELREDEGEIEAARDNRLPKLLTDDDIRGVFHIHTTWSDGRNDVLEMARAAAAAGYEYLGISDHAGGVGYTRGIDAEQLREQRAEIEATRRGLPDIGIFHGVEVDVLPDGTLGLDDAVLDELDFVIAALHSSLRLEREAQTARMIAAVSNPRVTLLAHPTTRMILNRGPIDVNMEAVVEAAVRSGCILEINAHPHRIDISGPAARRARNQGARFAIGPDAHSIEGFAYVRYGVAAARRAWLEPTDVVNVLSRQDMAAMLAESRQRKGAPPR